MAASEAIKFARPMFEARLPKSHPVFSSLNYVDDLIQSNSDAASKLNASLGYVVHAPLSPLRFGF
jgi:hypothetical protein